MDILENEANLRWTSWRTSNRPWLSSTGGGACEKEPREKTFLLVFRNQFAHYSSTMKGNKWCSIFAEMYHLWGCERVRPGQDSSVLTELGQLSPEAVSVPGHLVRQAQMKKKKIKNLSKPNKFNLLRWCINETTEALLWFNISALFLVPTSLSSLASLSHSSSMVMSSRGWGARGIGHGGGRGPCKGGDMERLISCSRKAGGQIEKVRKGKK